MPNPRVFFTVMPNPECPRSAQPQSLPGVPNPRVFVECPTQSVPGVPNVPNPRASLECRAQSVPGVPNPRVLPNPRVSLPREVGDVRSKIILIPSYSYSYPYSLRFLILIVLRLLFRSVVFVLAGLGFNASESLSARTPRSICTHLWLL